MKSTITLIVLKNCLVFWPQKNIFSIFNRIFSQWRFFASIALYHNFCTFLNYNITQWALRARWKAANLRQFALKVGGHAYFGDYECQYKMGLKIWIPRTWLRAIKIIKPIVSFKMQYNNHFWFKWSHLYQIWLKNGTNL